MSRSRPWLNRREYDSRCSKCGQLLLRGGRRVTRFDLRTWEAWQQVFCPDLSHSPCWTAYQQARRAGEREFAAAEEQSSGVPAGDLFT